GGPRGGVGGVASAGRRRRGGGSAGRRPTLTRMDLARSVPLFVLAALLEIGGAWLVWQGLREHRGWLWIGAGVVGLGLYGVDATGPRAIGPGVGAGRAAGERRGVARVAGAARAPRVAVDRGGRRRAGAVRRRRDAPAGRALRPHPRCVRRGVRRRVARVGHGR